MLRAFIKKFLKKFISITLDFTIFLRVGHGSSRGTRDPHEIWP